MTLDYTRQDSYITITIKYTIRLALNEGNFIFTLLITRVMFDVNFEYHKLD